MRVIGKAETDSDAIKAILLPGEGLEWVGKPLTTHHVFRTFADLSRLLVAAIVYYMLVSVALSLLRDAGEDAIRSLAPIEVIYGVVALVALNALIILLAPVKRFLLAMRMTYAVTDKRAIIAHGLFKQKIISIFEPRIIESKSSRNGVGKIIYIGNKSDAPDKYLKKHGPIGFFGLKDVREVERKLAHIRDH